MIEFTPEQIAALSRLVDPDRFSVGQSVRELHLHDISSHQGRLPAGVIWPITTEEASRILTWSYDQGIPVTPWGAGTSTEGNPVPTRGGLVMDFTRMNKILEIRAHDLQADVQPGVLRKELNRHAGKHGLFFPVDPGADASIGGMIANNASGVQTVKYGATKDYVMRMTVVLPQGEVISTGCRAGKSSSGYDLTRLFVGSEGTLGVVTEATLRLTGIPSHHLATIITFDALEDAAGAVAVMIGSGLEPAALELLTPGVIGLMNREKGLGLEEVPTLFCEFHGISNAALLETSALAQELTQGCGATSFTFGVEEKEREDLWRARHDAWETIHRAHQGKETLIVDAAIPISQYPEMVMFCQRLVEEGGAIGYVFGHAGDGNIHVVMMGDPNDEKEWSVLDSINDRIVARAIELGGTCTGEHGVGIGKRKFMEREHGQSYGLMKEIKNLVDPKGLMNPDKIFF
ncbi:MAG: 2-hydroxy-acid oxidase [Deltaproteobacteria bacterium]|nr:FAD-binding oxidoreductase [Deltaproteobacteria bacterium]MBW2076393.1 FAD-binding oxidoreductase [Deltaproteobacteria bacterium]MBW2310667.1 FAD-binding oxidoreductase [Deltaproteobacteria bacterium]RLB27320.1 MAG: 2-hydroxy-acid oxidase [Deltaproteobacteria bacterium]